MKLTVCIGSSCHLKGSRQVAQGLQKLVEEKGLAGQVEVAGTFCLGKCQTGVSVMLDDQYYSVQPATVETFFEKEVLSRTKRGSICWK